LTTRRPHSSPFRLDGAAQTIGAAVLFGGGIVAPLLPSALVLAACLAWAIDNNFTRRAAELDATWVASTKGLVAGFVNLTLALVAGGRFPPPTLAALAMATGFVTCGISLVLFVLALRKVGTARTGAYFSTAPFVGALLAVLMGEPADMRLLAAALLMGAGVWLHLTERHDHEHTHELLEHPHFPDAHHLHRH
jgi:drug/metabolite transporter (DMT)-like permease